MNDTKWRLCVASPINENGGKKLSNDCAYLSGQVLKDGGRVHCGGGTNTAMACGAVFQMPMNTSNGKLKADGARIKILLHNENI